MLLPHQTADLWAFMHRAVSETCADLAQRAAALSGTAAVPKERTAGDVAACAPAQD